MNDREANFEENLRRLLRASCGPETRVTPAARERLCHELAVTLGARPQPAEFAGTALAALTCLVLLLCAAWSLRAWTGCAGLPANFTTVPVMVLILVNMLAIPVASLVIVLRRKYV